MPAPGAGHMSPSHQAGLAPGGCSARLHLDTLLQPWEGMVLLYSPVVPRPWRTHSPTSVANGHCPLQLQLHFQLPALSWGQLSHGPLWLSGFSKFLHWISGILSQKEEEKMRNLIKGKRMSMNEISTLLNLSRILMEMALDGSPSLKYPRDL